MSAKKKISIKGIVVGEPSLWTSNSGTACIKFQVRCKDGLYECIAFHERSNIPGIGEGKTISVRGSYRDQEAFEGKTITIDGAAVEAEAMSAQDAILSDYGSVESYQKFLRETAESKIKLGYVKANFLYQDKAGNHCTRIGWFHRDRCTRHPVSRQFWQSIDLCMAVLGAREVTDRLKGGKVNISVSGGNANRYRDVLDGMLLEVNDLLSQEAPF